MSSTKCSHCGAEYFTGEDCEARFHRFLSKEFENPASYGVVHHLTVISYMLQHNEYSRAAWLEAREILAQFIDHNLAPAEMRRRNQRAFENVQRPWRVTEDEKLSEVDNIQWTRTIADVRLDNADLYRTDVRRWAESVLADSQRLAR